MLTSSPEPYIDMLIFIICLQQEYKCIGKVIDMHEFAERYARAPNFDNVAPFFA